MGSVEILVIELPSRMLPVLFNELSDHVEGLSVEHDCDIFLSILPENIDSITGRFPRLNYNALAFLGVLKGSNPRLRLIEFLFKVHCGASLDVDVVGDAEAIVAIFVVK